ncbi:MBL fold metallo-hydrolase [Desulfobacterales bacterium HSG17]|nr:MBL fold metallo-hydrolase [Desulfobacterales bacterium HSG17]
MKSKQAIPIKITTLVDNKSSATDSFLHEHGLAMLIETGTESILFDTGFSNVIVKNADIAGIDLARIKKVVLSHGHLDHAGGLNHIIKSNTHFTLIAHPGIYKPKVIIDKNRIRYFDISKDLPTLKNSGVQFELGEDVIAVSDNMMTTGYIPMTTDFEKIENRFCIQEDDIYTQDTFEDEKALVLKTALGVVVLLGCTHRGIINTLQHVTRLTGEDHIYAIMGGLHLGHVNSDKMAKICRDLQQFHLSKLIVGHCTGSLATEVLINAFGDKVEVNRVGKFIVF